MLFFSECDANLIRFCSLLQTRVTSSMSRRLSRWRLNSWRQESRVWWRKMESASWRHQWRH